MKQLNYQLSLSNTNLNEISVTAQPAGTDKFENVFVQGTTAYMSCGVTSPTIAVYDCTNPLAPVNTFNINAAGTYGCVVQGSNVYWGGSGSTYIYVASTTPGVGILGSYNLGAATGACYSVAIDPTGTYLFVATQSKGLTVLNVSNPAAITELFQEGGTTNKAFGVCLGQSGVLYVTYYDTAGTHVVKYVKTWNITSPGSPTVSNTYTFTSNAKPYGCMFWNNYLFVMDATSNSCFVLNVSSPSSPTQVATLACSASLLPGGNATISTLMPGKVYAYLGSGGNATLGAAIDVYDITTITAPVLLSITWSNVPNSAGGPVTLGGTLLYGSNYGVAPGNAGTLDIYNTTAVVSNAVPTMNLASISAILNVADISALAEVALQASNDPSGSTPSNFVDIPSTVTSVTNQSGLSLVGNTEICYEWVRLKYSTLGSGSVSAELKALGD